MATPPPHRPLRRGRGGPVAVAAVLATSAAVALTATDNPDRPPDRGGERPAPARSRADRQDSGTRLGRGTRRPSTQSNAPSDPGSPSPGPTDAPVRLAPTQQRAARAATRATAAFARAWTRYTANPADPQAARAVRATTTPALWDQLREVRAPAGRYRGADRYEAIAGVSVPLAGWRLEVTVALRDRAGRRQYLTVQAALQGSRWKIAQIVL